MKCWIAILLTLICFRGVHAGDDISGSANLTYRSTKTKTGEEEKSSWGFTQNYNIQATKEFTPKVNFAANLGINVNETNDTKTTRLTPDIRLNLRNEYFNADTGYRITEKGLDILTMVSDEDRLTTESWNVNLSTKSEKYPKVRLRYNEDMNYDHLAVRETDTKTTNFSGSADYAFRFLNFNYDYKNNVSDNYVTESTTETNTNEGRVNFRKSFWKNKIITSGTYSITNRKTETTTGGQEVRIGITHQNIGVELNFAKEVDHIYLYTTPPDPAFNKSRFTWAVYYSSDNSTWTLITSAASFDYDTSKKRFEIPFDKKSAQYFKVVNTANDTNNLYVTEIKAYNGATSVTASYGLYVQDDTPLWSTLNSEPALIDANEGTSTGINIGGYTTLSPSTTTEAEQTTQTTQANLRFKPTDWLSFTYDFTQDEQEKEEADADSTRTRRSDHNISGRIGKEFKAHKYLKIRPEYRRRQEYKYDSETEIKDKTTDTYLLHFLSSPLKTLDTDLLLNYTVSKEDGETQSKNSSALFQVAAKLREGADLDVDVNITRSESPVSQSETTTKSIDSNLRLELTRMLTSEIEYGINWTETQNPSGGTTGRTSNAKATFNWRPSHYFYFRASYGIDRDEQAGTETTQQQYNMNWLMTEKMRLDMGYILNRNDAVSSTYSSNLYWNLSRIFTLRFGYNWTRQEADPITETQTFTTNLSARF